MSARNSYLISRDERSLASSLAVGVISLSVGMVAGSVLSRYYSKSLARRPPYTPGQSPQLPSKSGLGKKIHIFDPSKLKSAYNLMISTVTPRPIALISSRNPETQIDNLAPFSYFGTVGHDPPMLAIGFVRKSPTVQKDSLVNILKSRQFAVNIISEWYLDAANHSCGNFPPHVDEFEQSGLGKVNCEVIAAPRVQQAAVTYECEVEFVHPIVNATGTPSSDIVLAKVVRIHVDQEVLIPNFDPTKPEVDTAKLKPVGRLGGNVYTTLGELVDIPRPKV